ncbi:MAG: hypothetical protein KatS3mg061_2156 [Dehalococcoidia bacterium]|nr:MAG: hypothetical protein KatS3mg061_2156 [Dehalococcoidia bacterium]
MNADGSKPGVIVSLPTGKNAERPSWSPDGTRIVFQVRTGLPLIVQATDQVDLYMVNADGSNLTRLTTDGISAIAGLAPLRCIKNGERVF